MVRNLPQENFSQQDLYNLFKEFGKVISCKLEVSVDGSSKGFGYVQYDTKETAVSALEKLNNFKVQDKEIQVYIFSKKNEREDQSENFCNLFVKNLPTSEFAEKDFRDIFG